MVKVVKKCKLKQLFCKHDYQEGVVSKPGDLPYLNLSGETATTICTKCGKIKGTRFVPNADGS